MNKGVRELYDLLVVLLGDQTIKTVCFTQSLVLPLQFYLLVCQTSISQLDIILVSPDHPVVASLLFPDETESFFWVQQYLLHSFVSLFILQTLC